jgi:hypothetical protein
VSFFHLKRLDLWVEGDLAAELQVTGTLNAGPYSRTIPLPSISQKKLCFHIALVPICMSFALPISMPINFNGASATVQTGASVTASALWGIEHLKDQGMVSKHNFTGFKVTGQKPTINAQASANIGLAFAPSITVDHVAKVDGVIKPELSAKVSYATGQGLHGSVDASFGVELEADVAVKILGHKIYSKSWGPDQVYQHDWTVYKF